ncbi:DUF6531 domain-containing protein [Streptomyces sp. G1]|uniref:DUF6531 domain-containing protein n=1 Tax=Streptomyces sp. G1 TaxID=361572 RepID=UPI0020304E5D|nr:DUF6531 domain-containing protein [Streptomyces sp. G1]MCM1970716.1 DUF6531 domain-containing protein [Streptomyces sp. G1]
MLDLDKDPVPGDPQQVRQLAKKLHDFADDVSDALRIVKGMAGESTLAEWAGKSADVFKEDFADVPKNLKKLKKSYEMCGDALADYWPKLERAQALADRALARGREAQADLSAAKSRLVKADSWVGRATKEADKYKDDPTGSKSTDKPDEAKVRAATRDVQHAETAQSNARGDVSDAKDALDAAKKMAEDARKMRQEAARTAKSKIDEASDAGIQNRSWWEEVGDWFVDNWDTIVAVCKVVVAVVGVIAMIIGGPILAAIVVVAGLIVLADTLYKYSKGQAGLMDVAFAAMDCIPGMKGLTTLGKLAAGAKVLGKGGLKAMGKGLGKGLRREADDAAKHSKPAKGRCKNGDPIDMISGDMLMEESDVDLPGLLPLVLRRTHLSSYPYGRFFGPSWASTLDERLELDEEGAAFAAEDGTILFYPVPKPGTSVLPLEGPRLELDWDGDAGAPIRITDPLTGLTRHFAPRRKPAAADEAFTLPLAAITDRNGLRIDFDRDDVGTPIAVRDSAGRFVHVDTDQGRVVRLRLRNTDDGPDGTVLRRFGYDSHGNLNEICDSSGQPWSLTYDARGRITSWTDRNGYSYRFTYDALDRCIAGEGDDGSLSCTVEYADVNLETRYTDALGHTTVYRYNTLFQLVAKTDPLGHTTSFEWDRYNRLLARTDALGRTTRYEYDEQGAPTAVVRPDGAREQARNNAYGQPVSVTQADGHVWRMEYDARGNLVTETDPTGGRITYSYNEIGALTAVTDAAGRTARLEPDGAGLPVAATDAEGRTTRYRRDAFGRVIAHTDPNGLVTRLGWTPEGRPSWRTLPDGTRQRRVYDGEGNLVEHIDGRGRTVRFEYGAFDQLVARTDPDGSRLEFGYDGQLRLISVTNQRGETWRYFYDAADRLIREQDFTGRIESYRFDAVGRLVGRTNGAGESIEYVRDALDNVTECRTPEGVTSYAYDVAGHLRRVSSADVELVYERDGRGRVLAETCNGRTVRSTYDALGRRTRRVTSSNAESVWEYDGCDRPVLLRTAGRTVAFAYDGSGREVERRIGAVVLNQSWDEVGRLRSQTVAAGSSGVDAPTGLVTRHIQHRAYHYEQDGTVAAISDLLNGHRSVDSDSTGRVTGVRAETWTERYTYDTAGNITDGQWGPGPAAEPQAASASAVGRISYEHDAQGRVVVKRMKRLSRKPDVWRYSWDSQDRLVGVTTPDGTRWTYQYDPFGRRIAKQRLAPDGVTVAEEVTFVWDGFVLAEQISRTGDSAPRCTVWDWEADRFSPVTQIERVPARDRPQEWIDKAFYSIVTDLVGTPTEMVAEDGELAWRARTTVWGTSLDESGAADERCPLRFPGQYHDPETSLNYNYQRHYDPETGQYASLDPLGLSPGPNPRVYVANPFTAVDPFGLAPSCDQEASDAARWRADLEQSRPGASKQTRPTVASGLTVPGHGTFTGASIKGGGNHNLHPDVQAAYDRVPQHLRAGGNQHGRCAEPEALSRAMNAGVDPRGGVSAAVEVRATGNPRHGTPKAPCSSCQHVLDQFGIRAVT